jgi:hypothetical protein
MFVNHRNLAVVLVFGGVLLSVVASVHPFDVRAQSLNQVGLVVGSGDGSIVTRCVEFAEDEISGYDLLMRSGLQVVATQSGGMGVTICEIDGEGCSADNCFCECTGSTCAYWSYWHLVGGEWSYSSVGANGHRVRPGDVDGWSWGKGDPPSVVPFEQICAPPATATSPPTYTPQPADMTTDAPTETWTPTLIPPTESPTPRSSATPTGTATLRAPTAVPSPTKSSQSVAVQRVTPFATSTRGTAVRPLSTATLRQATSTVGRQDREGRSNYIVFGVLVAVLLGAIVVVALQRKR